MTRTELLVFLRTQPWAVEASVSELAAPQAAVIGIALTDDLRIVFDTLGSSRKHINLLRNSRVALVIGWDNSRTVQYDGLAYQPQGSDTEEAKHTYFTRFPDGRDRERWPDIQYWLVRPTCIRHSDFTTNPPSISIWQQDDLEVFRRTT